jgi:hypothetical protein
MIFRFYPAVPRHFLFGIAGLLWTVAGGVLCVRGTVWLAELGFGEALEAGTGALLIAGIMYFIWFSRLVQKNINRIGKLPDRACVFAFTAWQGYVIIALMITAGVTLRNSSIPRYYLSLPYTSMGSVLLTGSVQFYREFLRASVPTKP